MHNLLTKLLGKRGIKDVKELTAEEQATFDNWQKILAKDELTLIDVKQFCQSQLSVIEAKWSDYNLEQTRKAELVPYFTVYKALLNAIDSPKVARQALETQLNQLLETHV